ncbi:MAG: hypothetical protein JOZ31_06200 [Verrucomicrobia bacterium]|nr:hypothetical protein [Verrucomicrobiota bacterium]
MNLAFKWKHQDGSVVEYSADGWSSDDPEKAAWLTTTSKLSSSGVGIPSDLRHWLQSHCELVEFRGPSGLTPD